MSKMKKSLSVLLSLLLIVTSVPVAVLTAAEGTVQTSASENGSIEIEGTALNWNQKISYAGGNLYNLTLTATANSNVRFESSKRTVEKKDYFKAADSGYYLIELWGGDGADGESTDGSYSEGGKAGKGGYVYGYVYLNEGDVLYSSIGGNGNQVAKSDPEDNAANAGGVHGETGSYKVGGGGGYSAVYLFTADDDFEGKYVNDDGSINDITEEDRTTKYIMIAGGGGGGGTSNSLIHSSNSLLKTRQTGTADGGNGGSMTSASGRITSGVKGTFYAGADGKSSGKSTAYIGKGGTNVPGEVSEAARNIIVEVLEVFGFDNWESSQPNDWAGTYNPAKKGGYGGDGNLRGGAGGAGFAGGSGGIMPMYGSANAYYIGGGGGGSSFIADTVTTDLESWMSDELVGENNSSAGGQSAVCYLGEDLDGSVVRLDLGYLENTTFTGNISKYFEVVSSSLVDTDGNNNGTFTYDSTTGNFTMSNVNVLNRSIDAGVVMFTANIALKTVDGFAGGNNVPVMTKDVTFTSSENPDFDLVATNDVKSVNVPYDFSVGGKSYIAAEPTTYALSDLYVDDYATVRANLASDSNYDFISSISSVDVYSGSSRLTSAVTVSTPGDYEYGIKMTVTPKNNGTAVVGPVQETAVFEATSTVTLLAPGTVEFPSETTVDGQAVKTLTSDGNGAYVLSLNLSNFKAHDVKKVEDIPVSQGNNVANGSSATYTVQWDGCYSLQAWGGNGGTGETALYNNEVGTTCHSNGGAGGAGGYVGGYINLKKGDVVTVTYGANGQSYGDSELQKGVGFLYHGPGGGAGGVTKIEVNGTLVLLAGAGGGGGCGAVAKTILVLTDAGDDGASVSRTVYSEGEIVYATAGGNGSASRTGAEGGTGGIAGTNYINNSYIMSTPSVGSSTLAQADYASTAANGGAAYVKPVGLTYKDWMKATHLYDLELNETISQYFEITGSSATVNGTDVTYDFSNNNNVVKFSNFDCSAATNDTITDARTVDLSTAVISVNLKAKDGFLGGNDVPLLSEMHLEQINGYEATNPTIVIPALDSTDYANVKIDYDFDDTFATSDATVISGESVNYADLYTAPTLPNDWTADFVTLTVEPSTGSVTPEENTSVTFTAKVAPKTAPAQKAKIEVEAEPVEKSLIANIFVKYSVDTGDSENVTLDGEATVDCGSDYSAVITADEGYTLPETITVKSGDTTLTAGTDYIYSKSTGEIYIYAEAITGNITIDVETSAQTYTVKFVDASDVDESNLSLNVVREGSFVTDASLADEIAWANSFASGKPSKDGYSYKWETIPETMPGNDLWIFGDYEPNTHTITVHYNYNNGSQAAEDYTEDTWYGNGYNITSPEVAGYVPSDAVLSGTVADEDIELTVTYTKAENTLSIFYIYDTDNTDDMSGKEAATSVSEVYATGANFSVSSPVIDGYTADVETVSGTMTEDGQVFYVYYKQNEYTVTFDAGEGADCSATTQKVLYNDVYGYNAETGEYGDLPTVLKEGSKFLGWYTDVNDESTLVTADTIYTPTEGVTLTAKFETEQHTITVVYQYEDGTTAAEDKAVTLNYGEEYSIDSPSVGGYTADKTVISGTVGNTNEIFYVHYTLNPASKEDLKNAIDQANALNEEDYTESTWAALQDAVEAGQEVYDDEDATAEEIALATAAILQAIDNLVDRSELKDAIDDAKALEDDPAFDDLTDEEKKALEDAIEAAEEVYNDPDATEEEIEQAIKDLQDAINDTLKEELQDIIEEAEELKNDPAYDDLTDEEKQALEDEIAKAEELLNDPDATEDDLKGEKEDLEDAIEDTLKEELQDIIDKAEELKDDPAYDDLTDEEKQALEDEIAKAEELINNPDATADELEAEKDALEDAIEDTLKEELQDIIDKAEELKDDPAYDDLTDEEKKALDDEIAKAEELINNPDATADELEDEKDALEDAIEDTLKEELQDIIDKAEELKNDPAYDDLTDEEKQAIDDEIAKAEELIADPDATVDELEAEKDALEDAIGKTLKEELQDIIDKAEELKNDPAYDDLTDEEKQALEDAIDAAEELINNPDATDAELEAGKDALEDAIEDTLKEELQDIIDKAEELKNDPAYDDLTEEEKKALDDEIAKAEELINNPDATADELEAEKDALEDAITDTLKEELQDIIDKAEELKNDPAYDDLTDEEKKALDDEIAAAEAIIADDDATADEIEAEKDALEDAIEDTLKEELQDLVDEAKALKEDPAYDDLTDEEKKALDDEIAAAEAIIADDDATADEIEAEKDALEDAIEDTLKEELQNLVDDAKALKEDPAYDDLTDEEKKALDDEIAAAEAIIADDDATADEIEAEKDALEDAIEDTLKEELQDLVDEAKALKEDSAYDDLTDEEKKALDDEIAAAEAIIADDDATADEIEAEKDALEDAIVEVLKDELQDKVDEAEALKDDAAYENVPAEDKQALEDAITAAEEVIADDDATAEDVKAAEEALDEAIAKVLKDELQDKVDEAEALKDDAAYENVPAEDKQALEDAIAAAEEVLADDDATAEDVKAAEEALDEAIAKVLKDELEDKVDEAEALKDDAAYENVPAEDKKALEDAIAAAEEVLADDDATAEEVKAAEEALDEAITKVLKDELQDKVDEAEALKDDAAYENVPAEDKKALEDAITAAEEVIADDDATAEEVKAAEEALDEAMAKVLKDELQALVDEANTFDSDDYTSDSWADVADAVTAAQAVLDDDDATAEEIKEATETLKDALDALVNKADYSEYDEVKEEIEDIINNHADEYDADTVAEVAEKLAQIDGALDKDLSAEDQETVDNAKDELEALKELLDSKKLCDYSAFEEALEAANNADTTNKTSSSVKALEEALAAAEELAKDLTIDGNPDNQLAIDAVTQQLVDAVNGLKDKAANTDLEERLEEIEEKVDPDTDDRFDPEDEEEIKEKIDELKEKLDDISDDDPEKEQKVEDITKEIEELEEKVEASTHYYVTYNVPSGDPVTERVLSGTKVSENAPAVADDGAYTFGAWVDGDGNVMDNAPVSADMTVTAKMDLNSIVKKDDAPLTETADEKTGADDITGLDAKTTVDEVKDMFENDDVLLKFFNYLGEELDGEDYVGTGSYMVLVSRNDPTDIKGEYKHFIIMGDVDGDGDVDSDDYATSKNVNLGDADYEAEHNYFKVANDIDGDGVIDVVDSYSIRRMSK